MSLLSSQRRFQLPSTRSGPGARGKRLVTLQRAHGLLRSLYDTTNALTRHFESIEETVPAVLSRALDKLGYRHAVLILAARGPRQAFVWQSHQLSADTMEATLSHARATHQYLVNAPLNLGPARLLAPAKRGEAAQQSPAAESAPLGSKSTFISLPIVAARGSVLGTLEIAFTIKPDEAALSFASALTNQLAIAIDRFDAEAVIQGSEKRFSSIVSLASDAIVTIDEERRITLFNRGAEQAFGYTQAEVLGKSLDLLLPPEAQARHAAHVREFAVATSVTRLIGDRALVFGRRKNGQVFPAEGAISKLEIAGKWTFTAVLRDVSEERRVEREQRFLAEAGVALASGLGYRQTLASVARLAVGSLADCCIIDGLDEHGQAQRLEVAMADPARMGLAHELRAVPVRRQRDFFAQSVLESHRAELISYSAADLLDLDAMADTPEHLQVLQQLNPRSVMSLPVISRQRLLVVISFVSTDPERQYGPKDQALAEELALRAGFAIENAQLYQRARQATRDREDLLAVVSHDLKTPLSNILMGVGMLLKLPEVHEHQKAHSLLERVERGAKRMGVLIGDLLSSASLEAGRLSVVPGPLKLGPLVSDALEAQRLAAHNKSILIENDVSSELPAISGDAARLQQVFANLLGNALKFTPAGGTLRVGARSEDGIVIVSVADTGPGIAEHDLPYLFDRFWQAERTAKLGNGLGLFIVKGIVEALGGTIWAESVYGRGTTFFFTLPVAEPGASALPYVLDESSRS